MGGTGAGQVWLRWTRSLWRGLILAGVFFSAGIELAVRRPKSREARADWLHRFAARALQRLRVAVEVKGRVPERGVVIANHQSYLDIVVFAALHRCVFCSKAEIEGWPVLGWMTTMAGTVYVRRGRGGSAAKAAQGMRLASAAGLPVVFFPEGTTSNGESLLKFHSGLLAQAMQSGEAITPAFVQYFLDKDNGPGVSRADDVAYWGERNMLLHIFRLLGLQGLRVTVRYAERPMTFSSELPHRKRAAEEARAAVGQLGRPGEQAVPVASS